MRAGGWILSVPPEAKWRRNPQGKGACKTSQITPQLQVHKETPPPWIKQGRCLTSDIYDAFFSHALWMVWINLGGFLVYKIRSRSQQRLCALLRGTCECQARIQTQTWASLPTLAPLLSTFPPPGMFLLAVWEIHTMHTLIPLTSQSSQVHPPSPGSHKLAPC